MLEVRLLGQFDVRLDGRPIEIVSRPAQSLLAYLILNPGIAHRREKLAGVLWPDASESHARGSLRQALWLIRQAIGPGREYLTADKVSVTFDPTSDYWLDTAVLDEKVSEQWTADELIKSLSVYGGELLPGFYEDWVVLERERLQAIFERKMEMLLDRLVEERRWPDVLAWGERWIALGQVPEPAYRALMVAHAALGNVSRVAEVFQRCLESLRAELGVEPSEQTRAAYEQLSKSETRSDLLMGTRPQEPADRLVEEPGKSPGITPLDVLKPAARRAAPPHNLPPQPTPFYGREQELTEIAQRLADPACRLLTLVGPGGIGKTRLALQAAAEHVEAFQQGVYFVPLASVSSVEFLVPAMADALKFTFYGQNDLAAQLRSYLREKEMLLIIDNFEHLLDGAEVLVDILAGALGVKLLVTSRERLKLQWEWVLDVQGMGVPESDRIEGLEGYSAVQLFVETARRVQSRFYLSDQDKPDVVRICRLVEGMPLGIELAAAWVRDLSCWEIAAEIERNLGFLETSLRDVPARHRSLRAAFDHSWSLLSEADRSAFRTLSIFRGGFRREAAERVAGATLSVLSALVDKSLLRRDPSGRYDIHELLRQYARDKLEAVVGEKETIQALHSAYYAEYLQAREARLKGEKQKETLTEIGEEIENVRESWNWAVEQAQEPEIDKSLQSLYTFYEKRGLTQEGHAAFGRVVERFRGTGRIEEELGRQRRLIVGKALVRQASFCKRIGLYEQARQLNREGLSILRSFDAPAEAAFSLKLMGTLAGHFGETTQAQQLLEESLALYRDIGDKWGTARALINLGDFAETLGQYAEAKRWLEESLAICRETGDQLGIAHSLDELGLVALALGGYADAKQLFQDSMAILDAIGDHWGTAICINDLGLVAVAQGEYGEAKQLLEASLASFREIGDQWGIALSFLNLGNAARLLGEYAAAKQLLEDSLKRFREIGDQAGTARSLNRLGLVAFATGEHMAAKRFHQESLAIYKEAGNRVGTTFAMAPLGIVANALGEPQEAKRYIYDALKTAMALQSTPVILDVLVGVAMLLIQDGEHEQALEALVWILHHPTSSRETKDRAGRLLAELSSQLPPQALAAAQERGKARKLEEAVEEILGEQRTGTF